MECTQINNLFRAVLNWKSCVQFISIGWAWVVYLRCDRRFRKLDMNINRFKIWAVVASFAITAPIFAEGAPNAEEGKKLYDANNCGSCHALDKKLVGPALRGVHERHSE